MKNLLQNKIVTSLVIVATLILAGVAIFTAIRLYQLQNENVSLSGPDESGATNNSPTPTPQACRTLTFSITTGTPTPTTPITGTITITPTAASSVTPTTTPGASNTPTTTPGSSATVTPTTPQGSTATPIAQVSPTPGGDALPKAGTSIPTLFAIALGSLVLVISAMLAL